MPCWIPWEAPNGSRGDPYIAAGRADERLPWSRATSLLHHCAGTGTELGIRSDSTALLDEESFQSEMRFQLK